MWPRIGTQKRLRLQQRGHGLVVLAFVVLDTGQFIKRADAHRSAGCGNGQQLAQNGFALRAIAAHSREHGVLQQDTRVLSIHLRRAGDQFSGLIQTLVADVNVHEVHQRADGSAFLLAGALEATDGHVEVVEFQTNLARVTERLGAVLRNLNRFLDATFRGREVVTFSIGAREVEEE